MTPPIPGTDRITILTIRGLDRDVIRKLKVRAATNDRSMEAELREIIKAAVAEEVC